MESFQGRTAVITGAASGLGEGLARQAAAEGLAVVISDVDTDNLSRVEAELQESGAEVLAQAADVSRFEEVEALAIAARQRFGAVHLLCNNAGVLVDGISWERNLADWRWSFDVNVFGVLHGIRAFLPEMLRQGAPGHIVNTASQGGLLGSPFMGPYTATKHAVVAISQSLYYELGITGASVGVSVLCPGPIDTGIWQSERMRPEQYGSGVPLASEAERSFRKNVSSSLPGALNPMEAAVKVLEGVRNSKFWLFTHDDFKADYRRLAESVLEEKNPEIGERLQIAIHPRKSYTNR